VGSLDLVERYGAMAAGIGWTRTPGAASWLLLEDDGAALTVTHNSTPFDVDAVVSDLRRRRHPNAEYVSSVLTG
jgi:hypothetical protein